MMEPSRHREAVERTVIPAIDRRSVALMAILRRISSFLVAILVAAPFPVVAYEVATVADGGTITGKVLFQGIAPTKKIIPTKDKEVCGGIRDEPEVSVGPDKGVEDAIVYLKNVPKGKALQKPAKPPEIVNDHCRFVPRVQAFPVGTVVIVNDDPILHNTHGFLHNVTVFNQALPIKGMHVPKPLTKPGLVRVDCDVHGWMRGWIYAADNPYYAVTKKDGTFSIPDVPPGSYTLVAWQEYTGETEVPVTVKPKEAAHATIELKKK